MKKNINYSLLFIVLTCIPIHNADANDEFVHGHKRSNGTIVESYYRTKANETINDNYSTKGNVNPYTGKRGTVTRESHSHPTSLNNTKNSYNSNR